MQHKPHHKLMALVPALALMAGCFFLDDDGDFALLTPVGAFKVMDIGFPAQGDEPLDRFGTSFLNLEQPPAACDDFLAQDSDFKSACGAAGDQVDLFVDLEDIPEGISPDVLALIIGITEAQATNADDDVSGFVGTSVIATQPTVEIFDDIVTLSVALNISEIAFPGRYTVKAAAAVQDPSDEDFPFLGDTVSSSAEVDLLVVP